MANAATSAAITIIKILLFVMTDTPCGQKWFQNLSLERGGLTKPRPTAWVIKPHFPFR
jgi:hypothetical protein